MKIIAAKEWKWQNVPEQMQRVEQNTSRLLFLYMKQTFQYKPQVEQKKHL